MDLFENFTTTKSFDKTLMIHFNFSILISGRFERWLRIFLTPLFPKELSSGVVNYVNVVLYTE